MIRRMREKIQQQKQKFSAHRAQRKTNRKGFISLPVKTTAILDTLLMDSGYPAPKVSFWQRLKKWLFAPFRAAWWLISHCFRALKWLVLSCFRVLIWIIRLPIRLITWLPRRLKKRRFARAMEAIKVDKPTVDKPAPGKPTAEKPVPEKLHKKRTREKRVWPVLSVLVKWCSIALAWPFGWLKRCWRKRKYQRLRDLPISASFVTYTLCAFIVGTLICVLCLEICDHMRMKFYYRYEAQAVQYIVPDEGRYTVSNEGNIARFWIYDENDNLQNQFTVNYVYETLTYDIMMDSGDVNGEYAVDYGNVTVNSHGFVIMPRYSTEDQFISILIKAIAVLSIPLSYGGALILCAIMFYRRKLKKPIAILNMGSERIARNDLDFTIAYDSRNEMGQLCDSFEKMRAALQQNNQEMWRHMEERKRLNAAFSHDLRTPLTVLKGHASMLLSSVPEGSSTPEEIVYEISAMSTHITRMEKYVEAMARLQRLEDVEVHREMVLFNSIAQSLQDSAQILCVTKTLHFEAEPSLGSIYVDQEIVQQVYENILANGMRFAKNNLCIRLKSLDQSFLIYVQDDGPGFSQVDLQKATHPFYKAQAGSNDGHLGLGLNICQTLCQRHGGNIHISNADEGGAIIVATFSSGMTR